MPDEDVRYRFIYDTVSKHAPTETGWEEFKTSVELAKFCDDSATLLLSCVYDKQGIRLELKYTIYVYCLIDNDTYPGLYHRNIYLRDNAVTK